METSNQDDYKPPSGKDYNSDNHRVPVNNDLGWDSQLASSLGLNRIKTRSGPLSSGNLNSFHEDTIHANDSREFDSQDLNRDGVNKVFSDGRAGKSVRTKGYALKGSTHIKSPGRSPEEASEHISSIADGIAGSSSKQNVVFQSSISELEEASLRMQKKLSLSGQHKAVNEDGPSSSKGLSKQARGTPILQRGNQSPSNWTNVESDFGNPLMEAQLLSKIPRVENTSQAETVRTEYSMDRNTFNWSTTDAEMSCSGNNATRLQECEGSGNQSETIKETDSPRFQALLRMTTGPRKKKLPNDIKSFSHELDPRGVHSHLYWRPHSSDDLEAVLNALRARFNTAKEEVNTELAVFAGNLVEILEKNGDASPDWKEKIEDLLILARQCAIMSTVEFRQQGENIVQELDDRRQELPVGLLKQLHTRMLFILTRCTRLLQFQKESGLDEDDHNSSFSAHAKVDSSVEGSHNLIASRKGKAVANSLKDKKARSPPRFYSQELRGYGWKNKEVFIPSQRILPEDGERSKKLLLEETISNTRKDSAVPNHVNSLIASRLASWKKFTASSEHKAGRQGLSEAIQTNIQDFQLDLNKKNGALKSHLDRDGGTAIVQEAPLKESSRTALKPQQKVAWGYVGELGGSVEDIKLVCRICEEVVPTLHLEEHSRVCAFADRCDYKALGIDERLNRLAETLEKMLESYTPKSIQAGTGGSPDTVKQLNARKGGEGSEGVSPRVSELPRRDSEDMLEDLHEMDAASLEDLRGFSANYGKTRFGPRSDLGLTASSTGSGTPCSPLVTPRTSQIDLLLAERCSAAEMEDLGQIDELVDIARCVANTNVADGGAMEYLVSCMQDLQDVLQHRKVEALTVDTFGKRIDKLLREKYVQVCEMLEQNSVESTSIFPEEDGTFEEDALHSLRSTPLHSGYKDRTSIDDFEIIKPISRGAFGRVFLARKRTTGDLFAIKVLRKADMIRKNAVESVQAERNILISARNPFVVRFFYSFTCRDNLYLVMEYLNGGDLYSMLRSLGCLEEDMARVYIAELVLALEYLHSLGVVHRDLKPDNILIAHDGHIKLTDFGLSKVGLINSTDDLSCPAVSSGNMLMDESVNIHQNIEYSMKRERRQQRSAVGTPDYLAPEILLGTAHGCTADWWSVGVILFEFLVGIPPFNAEHPQIIFDNILNRKIPWPQVPEDLSYEAQDLIDRLLAEDPDQRLGAKGATEVKAHLFFKDIKWETLARQKAAFIPSPDTAHDTSYFTSRHRWSSTDGRVDAEQEFPDSSDYASSSSSRTSLSSRPEEGDEYKDLADFESTPAAKYTFNNFSFKNLSQLASINYDLLLQSSKDSSKAP